MLKKITDVMQDMSVISFNVTKLEPTSFGMLRVCELFSCIATVSLSFCCNY